MLKMQSKAHFTSKRLNQANREDLVLIIEEKTITKTIVIVFYLLYD